MQKPGRFGKLSPQCCKNKRILSANLATDSVLLLIERLMLVLCDVTAIKSRHRALLVAYGAVFPVKLFGLLFGDLAFLQLMIDPSVLIRQPVIDLVAPRVIAFPLCFGKGRGHGAPSQARTKQREQRF